MWYKLVFLFNFSLLCSVLPDGVKAEPEILCLDDQEDYVSREWYGMGATVLIVESSHDLPGGLGEYPGLEGQGIFSFEGRNLSSQWLRKDRWDGWISGDEPVYMYLRYYGHVQNPNGDKGLTAYPGDTGSIDYPYLPIPPTFNYTWVETVVELVPGMVNAFGMGVSTEYYEAGDYLLIEKLIVVEGPEGTEIEDLRDLCPPKSM